MSLKAVTSAKNSLDSLFLGIQVPDNFLCVVLRWSSKHIDLKVGTDPLQEWKAVGSDVEPQSVLISANGYLARLLIPYGMNESLVQV